MPGGLLGIESLDRVEIEAILDQAKTFQPQQTHFRKSDQLRGCMIVNLFFEASTRDRSKTPDRGPIASAAPSLLPR